MNGLRIMMKYHKVLEMSGKDSWSHTPWANDSWQDSHPKN